MEARLRPRSDAGMVTAELAVALTVVILVLGLAMNAIVAGIDLIRCTDAARVAARAAARGDDPDAVLAVARDSAPSGATVTVRQGDRVQVVIQSAVRGPLAGLVPSGLEARAVAESEQTDESDRGSATVAVIAVIGAVLAILMGGLALISAATASTRARTAADLGALAGAERLVNGGGDDPCAAAAQVVRANDGVLRECAVSGESLVVQVAADTAWPGLADARARSRAGPAPAAARTASP